jgi:hypothetical protein
MRTFVFFGVLLVACGGIASTDVASGCPSADKLGSLAGTSCNQEGLTCGGETCTDACSFCNIVRCTGGVWTQEEAFPDPSCNDAPACAYPAANNDPQCPASYSYSSYQQPCSPVGLTCAYPGQGDGLANGCYATAMMWCKGDGGTGTWTVAQ